MQNRLSRFINFHKNCKLALRFEHGDCNLSTGYVHVGVYVLVGNSVTNAAGVGVCALRFLCQMRLLHACRLGNQPTWLLAERKQGPPEDTAGTTQWWRGPASTATPRCCAPQVHREHVVSRGDSMCYDFCTSLAMLPPTPPPQVENCPPRPSAAASGVCRVTRRLAFFRAGVPHPENHAGVPHPENHGVQRFTPRNQEVVGFTPRKLEFIGIFTQDTAAKAFSGRKVGQANFEPPSR